ncbi:anti-sigma-F factor Fin [Sporosarcina siberiensis]|uniref:Anti-sigma-F factor Fin n=1 Tax=Sporosarcina siberiensis TaxID=1365606 RepID=A0ABW4SCX4_9BACL
MAIRYKCRHCDTEIGSLPFESAKETLQMLQRMDETEEERFLTYEKGGAVTVRCICEHCEQSLEKFPNYYTLRKWLQ